MTIGERISELLLKSGKNEADLARFLSTKQSTISGWTKGGRSPNSNVILRICEFFEISPIYLLSGTDNWPLTNERPLVFGKKLTVINPTKRESELEALRTIAELTKRIEGVVQKELNEVTKDESKD